VIDDAVDLAISTCDCSPDCSAVFVHYDLPSICPGGFSEIHGCHHRDCSTRFYERMDCRVDDDPPSIFRVPAIPPKNLVWNGYCDLCRDIRNPAGIDEADEILVDLNENLVDSVGNSVVCSAEISVDSDENLLTVCNGKIPVVLAENHLDLDAETAVMGAVEVVLNASSAYLA